MLVLKSMFIIIRQEQEGMNNFINSQYKIQESTLQVASAKKSLRTSDSNRKDLSSLNLYEQENYEKTEYRWSQYEQKKYVNFIIQNRRMFQMSVRAKKIKKIHNKLSEHIHSRNPTQCRTHHQKLLAKWGSIDGIIIALKNLIAKRNLKRISHLSQLTKQNEQLVKIENVEVAIPLVNNQSMQVKEENQQNMLQKDRNINDYTQKCYLQGKKDICFSENKRDYPQVQQEKSEHNLEKYPMHFEYFHSQLDHEKNRFHLNWLNFSYNYSSYPGVSWLYYNQ